MYRGCDDCANFDVYIAGGDGTKVGYCHPTGAQKDSCYLPPFSDDVWGEYMYCDPWGPGLITYYAWGRSWHQGRGDVEEKPERDVLANLSTYDIHSVVQLRRRYRVHI